MNRVCSWAFPFLLAFVPILISDFRPTFALSGGDSRAAPSALDKMISDQAVLYVQVNDAPTSLKLLSECLFEPIYSEALQEERLLPLEFPGLQYFKTLESKLDFEWIPDLLASIRSLPDQLPEYGHGTEPFQLKGHYDCPARSAFTKTMQVLVAAFAQIGDGNPSNIRRNSPTVVVDAMFLNSDLLEYRGAFFTFESESEDDTSLWVTDSSRPSSWAT